MAELFFWGGRFLVSPYRSLKHLTCSLLSCSLSSSTSQDMLFQPLCTFQRFQLVDNAWSLTSIVCRSSIPPILATIQLSPIFPAASITLPSFELSLASPKERARIAASGCWHNMLSVVFVGILVLVGRQGQWWVGEIGRGVIDVEKVQGSLVFFFSENVETEDIFLLCRRHQR